MSNLTSCCVHIGTLTRTRARDPRSPSPSPSPFPYPICVASLITGSISDCDGLRGHPRDAQWILAPIGRRRADEHRPREDGYRSEIDRLHQIHLRATNDAESNTASAQAATEQQQRRRERRQKHETPIGGVWFLKMNCSQCTDGE
jgi:hypothetical protein